MKTVKIGDATLYLADCHAVLPTLAHAAAVVCDPPYAIGEGSKKFFTGKGGREMKWDQWQGTGWLGLALARSETVMLTPGLSSLYKYPEPTWIAAYSFAIGQKRAAGGRGRVNAWEPVLIYGKNLLPIDHKHFPPLSSEKVAHSAAKPLAPFVWLVRSSTLIGQTVLDPFMGSGTTGVACMATGRKFIGIEVDPVSFELACRRIAAVAKQSTFFVDGVVAAKRPLRLSLRKS